MGVEFEGLHYLGADPLCLAEVADARFKELWKGFISDAKKLIETYSLAIPQESSLK
jgi:hypothetical protein